MAKSVKCRRIGLLRKLRLGIFIYSCMIVYFYSTYISRDIYLKNHTHILFKHYAKYSNSSEYFRDFTSNYLRFVNSILKYI